MEMKENLYPRIPTAPPIDDQVIAKNKRNASVSRKGSSD